MDMNRLPFLSPYQRASDLGTTMTYMGSIMSFLAKGEDTAGRLALMELKSQPGNEPPPHVHAWEHELFYVLEGKLEIYCDGKVLLIAAGEMAFLPQGKPHAFYIRSPSVRMLVMVQASGDHAVGLDRYFIEMAEPAMSMDLPEHAITYVMDDPSHAIAVGLAHGIHILSPEETTQALPHYPGFGVTSEPASHEAVAQAAAHERATA